MNEFEMDNILVFYSSIFNLICVYALFIETPLFVSKIIIAGVKYWKLTKKHKAMFRGKVYLNTILKYELKSIFLLILILFSDWLINSNLAYI